METKERQLKILGIRHHGPGSARSVMRALEEMAPDLVLIEGPPEANKLVEYARADGSGLVPPVALLIYAQDDPRQACYYPFASFSPEWQALLYANSKQIACRFMDLPQTHWIGISKEKIEKLKAREEALQKLAEEQEVKVKEEEEDDEDDDDDDDPVARRRERQKGLKIEVEDPATFAAGKPLDQLQKIKRDPIGVLAELAGFSDGERWWEQMIEQRAGTSQAFEAISQAMGALREELDKETKPQAEINPEELDIEDLNSENFDLDHDIEPLREAHMRQVIRQAQKEGFNNIAIICGAWHAPALDISSKALAKEDAAKLKGLPKAKVEATWIPWTNGRLSFDSGYGAGVTAPGWYEHIFVTEGDPSLGFLVKAANTLREEDLDASPAQVIDALRLVETLSALRDLSHPGLEELQEALVTCILGGNTLPLSLIEKKLMVGEKIGSVPENLPGTPLMTDLAALQKRLRMKPDAGQVVLELDLRKPFDLEKSQVLARLNLLAVRWGEKQKKKNTGSTFQETWKLNWKPDLSLALVEASIWGRTVESAAAAKATDAAQKAKTFSDLVGLLILILDADLKEATAQVMNNVSQQATITGDLGELMTALPMLVQVARYGSVRGKDIETIGTVVNGVTAKIAVNLLAACQSLDEPAARVMTHNITNTAAALELLEDQALLKQYREVLKKIAESTVIQGLVSGRSAKLLYECQELSREESADLLGFALSGATEPNYAGVWLEGFLTNNAQVLVHDGQFFDLVDFWLTEIEGQSFQELLPLLRKTFGAFSYSERRQISDRVLSGKGEKLVKKVSVKEDDSILIPVLDTVRTLLGLGTEQKTEVGSKQ